jgi:hypothetical protein
MFGALREGEQPGMADTPILELFAGCSHEALSDPAVPQIGPGRQGSEKADTAPARRETRSEDGTRLILCSESGCVLGPEAAIDIIEVAPKSLWIGCAQEGPEGKPQDALRLRQVGFLQRANDPHASSHCRDLPRRRLMH